MVQQEDKSLAFSRVTGRRPVSLKSFLSSSRVRCRDVHAPGLVFIGSENSPVVPKIEIVIRIGFKPSHCESRLSSSSLPQPRLTP